MYHDEANTLSNQPWLQTNWRGDSRCYRCTTWNAVVVWGLCVRVLMCLMFIWKSCLVMKHLRVRLLSVTSQTSRVLSFAAETVRRGLKHNRSVLVSFSDPPTRVSNCRCVPTSFQTTLTQVGNDKLKKVPKTGKGLSRRKRNNWE